MSNSADSAAVEMSEIMAATWNTYVKAWNAMDNNDREHFLSQATVADSHYCDPNVDITGHKALSNYMAEFHSQMPNMQFILTQYICHHLKSIACWDLRDRGGKTLFSGVSYGTYNSRGKLTAEHGFFDTPDNP